MSEQDGPTPEKNDEQEPEAPEAHEPPPETSDDPEEAEEGYPPQDGFPFGPFGIPGIPLMAGMPMSPGRLRLKAVVEEPPTDYTQFRIGYLVGTCIQNYGLAALISDGLLALTDCKRQFIKNMGHAIPHANVLKDAIGPIMAAVAASGGENPVDYDEPAAVCGQPNTGIFKLTENDLLEVLDESIANETDEAKRAGMQGAREMIASMIDFIRGEVLPEDPPEDEPAQDKEDPQE